MPASRARITLASLTLLATLAPTPTAHAEPIPSLGLPTLAPFQGAPATAQKVSDPTKPEQNPFMAPDPNSNIHNDSWMSDSYRRRGPLGVDLQTASEAQPPSLCGSLAFDSAGRIVTVCPSIVAPPVARIIDPETLATIDEFTLPNAPTPAGTPEYQNFAGGGYFFLDPRDRMWIPTKTDHLYVLGQTADRTKFILRDHYDLAGVFDTETERITSALPDYKGRIWLVSKANGKVVVLDPETGAVRVKLLREDIQNSFAVAASGVYIVSSERMYRFKAGRSLKPRIVWKHRYRNSGVVKPGQVDAGSGTTPTVMENGRVAITDNADPMNVVVYRTKRKLRGKKRVICTQPVFEPRASATENSLIASGRSLLVENNYGYQDPFGPNTGAVTEPGVARVDVRKRGNGCRLAWTNREVRIPTVVPKLSAKTGLMYAYSRPPDPLAQGYYWTAIDFETGETAWMQYAGSGLPFNNNYAGLALGPNRSAYLGVTGGIIRLRDGG